MKGRDHVSRVHFARVFQVLLCYLSVILVSDVRRLGPVLRLYIYLKYCYVFKMLSIHSPKTTQALKDLELSNKFENADISDENQVTSLSNNNVWSLDVAVYFYNVIYLSFKTFSVLFQPPEKVTLKKNVLGESQLQVCTFLYCSSPRHESSRSRFSRHDNN